MSKEDAMRRSAIFFDAFLDGFTMAGLFGWLRRAGAPTALFEPEPMTVEVIWPALTFEPARAKSTGVSVAGDLRAVPDDALHVMIDLLKREDDARKAADSDVGQAGYASRR